MNKMNTDILLDDMKRLYSIRNDIDSTSKDIYEEDEVNELEDIMKGVEDAADRLRKLLFTKGAFYERG